MAVIGKIPGTNTDIYIPNYTYAIVGSELDFSGRQFLRLVSIDDIPSEMLVEQASLENLIKSRKIKALTLTNALKAKKTEEAKKALQNHINLNAQLTKHQTMYLANNISSLIQQIANRSGCAAECSKSRLNNIFPYFVDKECNRAVYSASNTTQFGGFNIRAYINIDKPTETIDISVDRVTGDSMKSAFTDIEAGQPFYIIIEELLFNIAMAQREDLTLNL